MIRKGLIGLMLVGILFPALDLHAEAPKSLVHYQGFITDLNETPVSGVWTLSFSFFPQQSGGTSFFVETQEVEVADGVFSVVLGTADGNPIDPRMFETGIAWLEVTVYSAEGESMTLQPRQYVTSQVYSMWSNYAETCGVATNAVSLNGLPGEAFVTIENISDVCMGPEDLDAALQMAGFVTGPHYTDANAQAYLNSIGVVPGNGYDDEEVAAYLLAKGYAPGPYFSGKWTDLTGAPDVSVYVDKTEISHYVTQATLPDLLSGEVVKKAMTDKGVFLMADGSVAAKGNIDLSGNQVLNVVIQNAASDKAPANAVAGQLWYDTTEQFLKVHDGTKWRTLGTVDSINLACQGCVDPSDVSFGYAGAAEKGGPALAAMGLVCNGCVDQTDLGVKWALGATPGGPAVSALSVSCDGCITLGKLAPDVMRATNIAYDNSNSGLNSQNIQKAIDELASQGPSNVVEGNGTVVSHMGDWLIPALGSATQYMQLMNPTTPKVIGYLYGMASQEFSTAADLTVAADTGFNEYGYDVVGTAGSTNLTVTTNPAAFKPGDKVMIYQTVGTGGSGTNAGKWELNEVKLVSGTTLTMKFPLKNSYSDVGANDGQSQIVKAATYANIEVKSGGIMRPSVTLPDDASRGGILYIRANTIIVRNGGKIMADGYGFESLDTARRPGDSECRADPVEAHQPNCSGGGGGYTQANCGGGGGGNKTAGTNAATNGCGLTEIGLAGLAKGTADTTVLTMGGAGGNANATFNSTKKGNGGGLIVIGAKTLTVEAGGSITSNGMDGNANYCGGGAGGTVAIFADKLVNNGTIAAVGGKGHVNATDKTIFGGDGGAGYVFTNTTIAGVIETSVPMGVEMWLDGTNVTAALGDPNSKGAPYWDDINKKWGKTGTHEWSSGPLDLSASTNWTLGEHNIEVRETGGSGGIVKLYTYVIYPFTKSQVPSNNTCGSPQSINVMQGHVVVSGTTEDLMGKIKATDDNVQPFCGGSSGPDVVYKFELTEWRHLALDLSAPFKPRMYIRKDNCLTGKMVACGEAEFAPEDLKSGVYYLFVDSDGATQKGNFTLTVDATPPGPPANDTCDNPAELFFDETGKAERYGVTLFSTNAYSAACGGSAAPDNVYKITIPAGTTKVNFNLVSDFNPVMYLYTATCPGNSVFCAPAKSYQYQWPSPGTYFLVIDGKTATDKGEFTLTITVEG